MWREVAKCNHCGEIVAEKNFSSSFFIPVCPKCGGNHDVDIVVAREVYKGKWYNPLTWLDFGFEIKEDSQ